MNLKLCKCKYIEGEFNPNDHLKYEFGSIAELLNSDLTPAGKGDETNET